MKRKICLSITICMVLSLCACGNQSSIATETSYVDAIQTAMAETNSGINEISNVFTQDSASFSGNLSEEMPDFVRKMDYDIHNQDAVYGEEITVIQGIIYHFDEDTKMIVSSLEPVGYINEKGEDMEPGIDHYNCTIKFSVGDVISKAEYFCTPEKNRYERISGHTDKSFNIKNIDGENKTITMIINK